MDNTAADDGERHYEVGDETYRMLTEEGVRVTDFERQKSNEAPEREAGPLQHFEASGRGVDRRTRESITPSVGSGKSKQNAPTNDSAPTFPDPVRVRDKGKGRDGEEIPMVPYGRAGAALTAWKRESRDPPRLLEKPDRPTEQGDEVAAVGQKTKSRRPRSIKKPGFRAWWDRHVRVLTPLDGDIRDYLALERTYLAHLRTSMALVMVAVVVAQLFVLRAQSEITSSNHIEFHAMGKATACALIAVAIVESMVGAWRFAQQQNAMLDGNAIAGGLDLLFIWLLMGLVTLAVWVSMLVI